MKKRGRPPTGLPFRKPIQVKLSESERKLIDEAAAISQLDTSTWMREICLRTGKRIISGS